MTIDELLSQAWSLLNRRRGVLIDRRIYGILHAGERVELDALNAFADEYLSAVAPRPTDVLIEYRGHKIAQRPSVWIVETGPLTTACGCCAAYSRLDTAKRAIDSFLRQQEAERQEPSK